MSVDRQAIPTQASQSNIRPVAGGATSRGIPPLNAGDHLSRAEFERKLDGATSAVLGAGDEPTTP